MMDKLFQNLRIEIGTGQPLAIQLADQITWLVASGQIPAGSHLPAVRYLAGHLGINLHTVRAAYRRLEENHLIATRQGAGSVVLGFDPIQMAEKSSNLPTHTVGIIVPDSANPFYPAVINGMLEVTSQHHILLTICDTHEDHETGKEYLDMLVARRVDGLIIAPFGLRLEGCNDDPYAGASNCPVPIVYVDRPDEPGYSVLLDAEGAGYRATQHLIQHGRRRIASITGNRKITTLAQCFSGYTRAIKEAGLPLDETLIVEKSFFTYEAGYTSAQKLLALPEPPDAIFAIGDIFAIGAMRAILDGGLRIPEDMAVMGYNNIDVAAYTNPPLSTVNTPMKELGRTSMKMLYQLICGEEVPQEKIILPTELIPRGSCGCNP